MSTRVLLVDDHAAFRHDVSRFLMMLDGCYEVIAQVESGEEALDLVAVLRPDIVLTDIELPGDNGIEVTRRIHQAWPRIAVVVMSNHAVEVYRQAALDAGAIDFVDKMELAGSLPGVLAAIGAELRGAVARDRVARGLSIAGSDGTGGIAATMKG